MSAAAEPLKTTPADEAVLAQLRARIRELNNQLAIEHRVNEVLRGHLATRTHDVPGGEAL